MRDKIVFFVLGAILATIAYSIGDLETLTAEDQTMELDHLFVNRLTVKDSIGVGGIGKKSIMIISTNKYAQIDLVGSEIPKNHNDLSFEDNPIVSLVAGNDGASIKVMSHSKRPEASCLLGITKPESRKYTSALILRDLNGIKGISSDSN